MKTKFILCICLMAALLSACGPPGNGESLPTSTSALPPTRNPTEALPPQIDVGSVLLTGDGSEVTITKLERFGSQDRWAVGSWANAPDLVLYSGDGGQGWADRTPPDSTLDPASRAEAAVAFWDASTGWVIFNNSNLLWKTTDAGASWKSSTLGSRAVLGALIDVLDPDTAWVMLFSNVSSPRSVDIALYRTLDGGESWELMLDPTMPGPHSFGKFGFSFGTPEYGWIGREQGFFVSPYLDVTHDGGRTWEQYFYPSPPDYPGFFDDCTCDVHNPQVSGDGIGAFHLSCRCFGEEDFPYTQFEYQTLDDGASWSILAIPE